MGKVGGDTGYFQTLGGRLVILKVEGGMPAISKDGGYHGNLPLILSIYLAQKDHNLDPH